ncbi:MAG: cytochrome c3 family protein [Sulfurimonas sp.]|uniref:cytochrome c3 family protein n=1 Tax=Sulfurimonas sp. TaxID=2022749 RepID=UPI0025CD9F24|nr:cytochrome c3 family protein [Sulfurimonas sp.]MCK9454403.1 hypothetical protein [Sulfurimonas sp.]
MKNCKFTLLLFIYIFCSGSIYAASVVGSKHDLSMSNYYGSSGNENTEVCVFCHTPHSSNNQELSEGPLWNRKITDTSVFEMYNGTPGTPSHTSMLCLSCHDGISSQGVSAVSSYDGHNILNPPGSGVGGSSSPNCKACHPFSRGEAGLFPSEVWQIGPILSDDHPVSIDYNDAATAKPSEFKAVPDSDVKLFGGKVECATCHDVHNPEYGLFLRKPNTGSSVCNSCHIK